MSSSTVTPSREFPSMVFVTGQSNHIAKLGFSAKVAAPCGTQQLINTFTTTSGVKEEDQKLVSDKLKYWADQKADRASTETGSIQLSFMSPRWKAYFRECKLATPTTSSACLSVFS